MLQMQVESHMRGRIMSIDMMSHGLMPLGVFPISLIAEHYGVGAALVTSGCALMAITLLVTFSMRSVRSTLRAD
jgi:sugar phosphate permease